MSAFSLVFILNTLFKKLESHYIWVQVLNKQLSMFSIFSKMSLKMFLRPFYDRSTLIFELFERYGFILNQCVLAKKGRKGCFVAFRRLRAQRAVMRAAR